MLLVFFVVFLHFESFATCLQTLQSDKCGQFILMRTLLHAALAKTNCGRFWLAEVELVGFSRKFMWFRRLLKTLRFRSVSKHEDVTLNHHFQPLSVRTFAGKKALPQPLKTDSNRTDTIYLFSKISTY